MLVWERAREPQAGAWALPGGYLEPTETLEDSIRRHLAAKVDVRELSHLEQLGTWSAPARHPAERQLATAYLGLVPADVDPAVPEDTAWHPVDRLPRMAFDHGEIVLAGRERLRAKLSYTNLGFALAPPTFTISELLEDTGERRLPGPHGGRPATVFRFRSRELAVTDQFAVLRPPTISA